MILVLNRLQQLSGNNRLFLLGLLFLAACSPKVVPEKKYPVTPAPDRDRREKPVLEEKPIVIEKKVKPEMTISLVLPFDLSTLNYKTANSKDLTKAELAIDFYQGFKMAMDSVANNSETNFKLQVYDSKDDPANIAILASKAGIKNSDLIVGPIFPNGITAFAKYSKAMQVLTVSPLAASDPSAFNNPYLVSINNSLDQHAYKALSFIKSDLKAKKIVLIRSGQADEYKYAVPFKKGLDSLAKGISFSEIGIKAVGYENVFKSLSPVGLNVVVLPSTERSFLMAITKELVKLSANFRIAVIGHPSWEKLQFLDVATLESINAHITSSYKVEYKTARVNNFIRNYRANFNLEPGEFAFKGFDTG
ncbi:MAG: amino acid ABC transporter substrate-binding protein, partial [Pedobacter sp.]